MAACEFLGNELESFCVYQHIGKINTLLPDGPRHDVADDRFRNKTEPHQQPPNGHVLRLLLGEPDAQLVLGNEALLNQQFAQTKLLALLGHRASSLSMLYAAGQLANALDNQALIEAGMAFLERQIKRLTVIIKCRTILTDVFKADGEIECVIRIVLLHLIG